MTCNMKRSLSQIIPLESSCDSFDIVQPQQKRPRRITTPNSALSFVTQEQNINDYSPQSNTSVPLYTPSSSSYQYSPSSTRSNLSDEEIEAHVENSFANGYTKWTNETLVEILADEIDQMCINNEEYVLSIPQQYHNFYSQCKQPFDLEFYIRRLVHYSNCSTAAFVIMLVYIQRLQENCKHLLVTDMNVHRVVSTSLLLAIKYLDDEVFSNTYYARVFGVTSKELNDLELKLLQALDFKLSVSPEVYANFEDHLNQSAQVDFDSSPPASPIS